MVNILKPLKHEVLIKLLKVSVVLSFFRSPGYKIWKNTLKVSDAICSGFHRVITKVFTLRSGINRIKCMLAIEVIWVIGMVQNELVEFLLFIISSLRICQIFVAPADGIFIIRS